MAIIKANINFYYFRAVLLFLILLFLWKGLIIVIEEKVIEFKTYYGYIESHLKEIMDKKGISIYMMSQLSKIKYDVVKRYYKGENYNINTDILAKFCYVLGCDVQDIIKYKSD